VEATQNKHLVLSKRSGRKYSLTSHLFYAYLSERFNRQFEADDKRGLVFTMFTVLAILIACLGLFGLASYMVEQRTKEIGIRKVFGANENTILGLISKDFSHSRFYRHCNCSSSSILFYEQMA